MATLGLAPVAEPAASLSAKAAAVADRLEDEVNAALGLLTPLRARLRTGEPTDWKAFDAAVSESRMRRPTQQLVLWAPRVSESARAGFEADSGRDAFRSLRVVEPAPAGALVPAQSRDRHHPLALAAPLQPGAELLGLDLMASTELEPALAKSAEAGQQPIVVGPLTLLPPASCESQRRPGCTPQIFVVVPVRDDVKPGAGRNRRREDNDRGYLLVALSWAAIVSAPPALPGARTSAAFALPALPRPTAQVGFRVLGEPWTLELAQPPGGILSARLGHGRAPANP